MHKRIFEPKRDDVMGGWWNCMSSSIICTLHQMLGWSKVKDDENILLISQRGPYCMELVNQSTKYLRVINCLKYIKYLFVALPGYQSGSRSGHSYFVLILCNFGFMPYAVCKLYYN